MSADSLTTHLQTRFADTAYPLTPLLDERWSPRAFTEDDVSLNQLGSILEAARWSASCFNAQPWRLLVGHKTESPQTYTKIFNTLVEFNQAWCQPVPVLVLAVARTTFPHNGKSNPHAWHDVGMATTSMMIQGQAMGIHSHSMAGFDAEATYDAFAIPRNEYEPVAVTAFGYAALPEVLTEADGIQASETAPRVRQPLNQMAFAEHFGQPFSGCFT